MPSKLSYTERQARIKRGECFRCGIKGHMASHHGKCPAWVGTAASPPPSSPRDNLPIPGLKRPPYLTWPETKKALREDTCFRCGVKGHKYFHTRLCPLKTPQRIVVDYARVKLRPMTISFMDLPRELRDAVYDYTWNWNDGLDRYRSRVRDQEDLEGEFPRKYSATYIPLPKRHTPNVFLLNKQIYSEACERVMKKSLILYYTHSEIEPFEDIIQKGHLAHFISPRTAARVGTIEFVMDRDFIEECMEEVFSLDVPWHENFSFKHFIITLQGAACFFVDPSEEKELVRSQILRLRRLQAERVTLRGEGLPEVLGHGMSWMPLLQAIRVGRPHALMVLS